MHLMLGAPHAARSDAAAFGTILPMRRSPETLLEDALAIWRAGVAAVDSERLVREFVRIEGSELALGDYHLSLRNLGRIVVVGAGKAGAGMARGLEAALGPEHRRLSGLINVPADCAATGGVIELLPARPAHRNEPAPEGVAGARRMLKLVASLRPNDLCICLLSGGGSALTPAPRDGLTLEDKLSVTRFLASRGANIEELNTVRKQLSDFKGGRLASACRAGVLATLVISDVMGDRLDLIASGPTYSDSSTPAEALAILEQFGASGEPWFDRVSKVLRSSAPPPPPPTAEVHHFVIGNNALAVDAAGIEAERRGYSHAMTSSRRLEGDAEELGRRLARLAMQMRRENGPDCLISGGEPVVAWHGGAERGKGGRNQQLALAAAMEMSDGAEGIVFLSGGVDGEDGPTDAAGAWVDATTMRRAAQLGVDAAAYLTRQDAYPFFEKVGGLIKTGPTHTNVGDLRVIVVDRIEAERHQAAQR